LVKEGKMGCPTCGEKIDPKKIHGVAGFAGSTSGGPVTSTNKAMIECVKGHRYVEWVTRKGSTEERWKYAIPHGMTRCDADNVLYCGPDYLKKDIQLLFDWAPEND
jgi:hypothetical protein